MIFRDAWDAFATFSKEKIRQSNRKYEEFLERALAQLNQ